MKYTKKKQTTLYKKKTEAPAKTGVSPKEAKSKKSKLHF